MRHYLRLVIFAAVFVLAWTSATSQQTHSAKEQLHFSAEDEGVQHPVALLAEVSAILEKDNLVRDAMEDQNVSSGKLPASWFSTSTFHLASPDEKDLIVCAKGPLRGANVNTFWVFVRKGQAYSLALTIPAHDLGVRNSRSRGYRNIETMGATAVTVTTVEFHFGGSQYKECSEKTEDIK